MTRVAEDLFDFGTRDLGLKVDQDLPVKVGSFGTLFELAFNVGAPRWKVRQEVLMRDGQQKVFGLLSRHKEVAVVAGLVLLTDRRLPATSPSIYRRDL